jgi:hypothetical protein
MGVHEALIGAIKAAAPKPDAAAKQSDKKNYSERLSNTIARALSGELRIAGVMDCAPLVKEDGAAYGSERRIAGGIGAKKVDVSWATDTSGLLLGISIKTISFPDARSGNYQKNLSNRRGDMLFEAVTLHRRFPFAVLAGLFFLDIGAASDGTERRSSTLQNAHDLLRLFSGRPDPAGREEQLERLYVVTYDATPGEEAIEIHEAGCFDQPALDPDSVLAEILSLVADRNSDFYDLIDGVLVPRR